MSKPGHYQASGISPPILEIAHRLYQFMLTQSQPITEKDIHKQVKGRRSYKLAALRLFLVDGTIIRSGAGKHRSSYVYIASQIGSKKCEYKSAEKFGTVEEPWVPGTERSIPISETIALSNVTNRPIAPKRPARGIAEIVSTTCHSHSADRVELLQDLSSASRPAIAQPLKIRGSTLSRRE